MVIQGAMLCLTCSEIGMPLQLVDFSLKNHHAYLIYSSHECMLVLTIWFAPCCSLDSEVAPFFSFFASKNVELTVK